jgi:hypothetical protein
MSDPLVCDALPDIKSYWQVCNRCSNIALKKATEKINSDSKNQ